MRARCFVRFRSLRMLLCVRVVGGMVCHRDGVWGLDCKRIVVIFGGPRGRFCVKVVTAGAS